MNKITYNRIAIFVLTVLHIVGIFGLNIKETKSFFESISHINISISLLLVLFADEFKSLKMLLFFTMAFCIGMAVEILGVKTGFPFGNYFYTDTFGPSVLSVPVAIGLNWFLLSLCVMNLVKIENLFFRCVLAAALMTGLDFILEPFAIKHGYWVWTDNGLPPLQNYTSWFLVSLVICFIYTQLKFKSENGVSAFYLSLLVVFLLIDNLVK